MSLPSGLGKYKFLRRLGVGGMAEVYEARVEGAAGFSKRLAVKVLLPGRSESPELVAMFIDEARIVAGLNHPNIVYVYEFGESNGTYFMAMELLDGLTLDSLLERYRHAGQPFPAPAAALVTREICKALSYIHAAQRDIVHRDVTPQNIFVTSHGQVKLGDFGIAKAADRLTQTEHGQIKGKLQYLAPEQVVGETITARTDIYAAGLVLWELLVGRRLLQGESHAQLLAAAAEPTVTPPSALRLDALPLDAVVLRALERSPALRYPRAQLVVEDLECYLATHPCTPEELLAPIGAGPKNFGKPASVAAAAPLTVPLKSEPSCEQTLCERPPATPVDSMTRRLPGPQASGAARWQRRWLLGGGVLVVLAGLGLLLHFAKETPTSTGPNGAAAARQLETPRDARRSGATLPDSNLAQVESEKQPLAVGPIDPVPQRELQPASSALQQKAKRRLRAPGRRQPPPARRPPTGATADSGIALRTGDLGAPALASPAQEVRQPAPHPEQLRDQLDQLLQRGRQKGLWPEDRPALHRLVVQAREAIAGDHLAQARAALAQLEQRVAVFQIDRAFTDKKMNRLEQLIAQRRLSATERDRVDGETQAVLHLILRGQLVEASNQLSAIVARLTRASAPREP